MEAGIQNIQVAGNGFVPESALQQQKQRSAKAVDLAWMLPEFNLYQPREAHPRWAEIAAEAHKLVEELRPTLPKPASKRKRKRASYRSSLRNYLDNRKLIKQGREDLRPLYFIWTMLRTCNFTCSYCDDHQGNKYPDLPNQGVLNTEEGKELLRIMRTRTSSVYFAGGEPTIRQDLPELTRTAVDLDYYPIIINTNGSLLHRWMQKPDWKDWLGNMDIIIVSLDALDLKMLKDMWVYKKASDVMLNILMLRTLSKEMGFKFMVNTVIQPDSIDEAADVLDFANDMDIWFCPVPMNIGPTINGELLADERYLALAHKILERQKQGYKITGSPRMNRRFLFSEPLNCRNTLKPHIDYDGSLVWPCKAAVNTAPRHLRVLDYEHVDDLYDAASALVNPTKFHGPADNQCGANCNWAQNYTTDTYAHGLQHPLSLLADVKGFLRS